MRFVLVGGNTETVRVDAVSPAGADPDAMDAYVTGDAKEGVGMGGALALADAAGVSMAAVRENTVTVYDRLVDWEPTAEP